MVCGRCDLDRSLRWWQKTRPAIGHGLHRGKDRAQPPLAPCSVLVLPSYHSKEDYSHEWRQDRAKQGKTEQDPCSVLHSCRRLFTLVLVWLAFMPLTLEWGLLTRLKTRQTKTSRARHLFTLSCPRPFLTHPTMISPAPYEATWLWCGVPVRRWDQVETGEMW